MLSVNRIYSKPFSHNFHSFLRSITALRVVFSLQIFRSALSSFFMSCECVEWGINLALLDWITPININTKELLIMQFYAASWHFLPSQVKVAPEHNMKAYRRRRSTAPLIHNSSTRRKWMIDELHTSAVLYFGARTRGTHWTGGWVVSRGDTDLLEDRRISYSPPGTENLNVIQ